MGRQRAAQQLRAGGALAQGPWPVAGFDLLQLEHQQLQPPPALQSTDLNDYVGVAGASKAAQATIGGATCEKCPSRLQYT